MSPKDARMSLLSSEHHKTVDFRGVATVWPCRFGNGWETSSMASRAQWSPFSTGCVSVLVLLLLVLLRKLGRTNRTIVLFVSQS